MKKKEADNFHNHHLKGPRDEKITTSKSRCVEKGPKTEIRKQKEEKQRGRVRRGEDAKNSL